MMGEVRKTMTYLISICPGIWLVVHFLIYSHDSFFFLDLFVSLSGHILVNANVDYNGRFHLSRGCGEAHLLSVDNCNGQHWPVTVVDQTDRQMWWITLLDNCGPTFRNWLWFTYAEKNVVFGMYVNLVYKFLDAQ